MKKHRSILITLVALLTLSFSFGACGGEEVPSGQNSQQNSELVPGEEHEHTFSEAWSNNEKNHWHAATCEHGENRKDYEAHVDVDEDGKCDACAFEVGHTHTFGKNWLSDENNHWKEATCTHTEEKGEVFPHADENTDGKCDTCEAHVHVLNILGYCSICGDEVKELDTGSVPGRINAVLARKNYVTGGTVEYKYQGSIYDDHKVEYAYGTNGTYTKNIDVAREVNKETGTFDRCVVESYLKKVSEEAVTGIAVTFVNDKFSKAEELSYSMDNLRGYYYSVSSLTSAYGAEEILASLYETSLLPRSEITKEQVFADENKCVFAFNTLTVNAMSTAVMGANKQPTGEKVMVYNVHYYEIEVEFVYTKNNTLTDLNIVCKHYANDTGRNSAPALNYYPETDTFKVVGNPDTYTYTVKQTEGRRMPLDLDKGENYKPKAVEFYADKALENKVDSINLYFGQAKKFYIGVNEGATVEMLALSPEKLLVAEDGTETTWGFCLIENTNEITFNNTKRMAEGNYKCTLTWVKGENKVVKEINITVLPRIIEGQDFLNVTSGATSGWSTTFTPFMFDVHGVYTFYLPKGVTMALYNPLVGGQPTADDLAACKVVGTSDTYGATKVEVDLTNVEEANIRFRFKFDKANTEYLIGFDLPTEK